ncbi:hypothetical protein K474DRAFT_1654726 [Panus rudis PR-1116 ss-1]|nr:hypothetical protein K474DRAFT_1654726 [Panus rudis PR-1116 ss-1]
MADEEYEVEQIVKAEVRKQRGGRKTIMYLVKWKGYDNPSDNTWEPPESFEAGSEHFIENFWDRTRDPRDRHDMSLFKLGEEILPRGPPPKRRNLNRKPSLDLKEKKPPVPDDSEGEVTTLIEDTNRGKKRSGLQYSGSETPAAKRKRGQDVAKASPSSLTSIRQVPKKRKGPPGIRASEIQNDTPVKRPRPPGIPASTQEVSSAGPSLSRRPPSRKPSVPSEDEVEEVIPASENTDSSAHGSTFEVENDADDASVDRKLADAPAHPKAAQPKGTIAASKAGPGKNSAGSAAMSKPGPGRDSAGRSTTLKPGPGRNSGGALAPSKTGRGRTPLGTSEAELDPKSPEMSTTSKQHHSRVKPGPGRNSGGRPGPGRNSGGLHLLDAAKNVAKNTAKRTLNTVAERLKGVMGTAVNGTTSVAAAADEEEKEKGIENTVHDVEMREVEAEVLGDSAPPQSDEGKRNVAIPDQSLVATPDKEDISIVKINTTNVGTSAARSPGWKSVKTFGGESTIFGPLGIGHQAVAMQDGNTTERNPSISTFSVCVSSSTSFPVSLKEVQTTNDNKHKPLSEVVRAKAFCPPGKFYKDQYALDLVSTLRSTGSYAQVVPGEDASEEQKQNFERFRHHLVEGQLFVATIGQATLAFCSSGMASLCSKLDIPHNLIGSGDHVVVAEVEIVDDGAYFDAAFHATEERW